MATELGPALAARLSEVKARGISNRKSRLKDLDVGVLTLAGTEKSGTIGNKIAGKIASALLARISGKK